MLDRASTFDIAVTGFAGPLDVLLDLIEDRKLSINEVSLSAVVEEFVKHSRARPLMTREEAAAFLAVASTLILIKSRSLLPAMELTSEEEGSIGELERRLAMLREFRRLAKHMEGKRRPLVSREAFCGYVFGFLPPHGMTGSALSTVMRRIIESFPSASLLPEKVLGRIVSIEEKARELLNRIGDRLSGSLETVVVGADAAETIIGFLALLELIKQGLFDVEQKTIFGEIELKRL
ncbi:MAG: segregation/condensation protein A [Candidatus Niyogibacteria bacterium]|nr:segregation/condensation protein A [Candidatus Niyogibacteria bacterium]